MVVLYYDKLAYAHHFLKCIKSSQMQRYLLFSLTAEFGGWVRWSLKAPSNPNHASMILMSFPAVILKEHMHKVTGHVAGEIDSSGLVWSAVSTAFN